jgi:hypothetical protein
VNFVAFFQEKFRQIRSVLSSDAGDEGFFHAVTITSYSGLSLLRSVNNTYEYAQNGQEKATFGWG